MKLKLFIAILSFFALSSFTLTPNSEDVKIIEIENLNPDLYKHYVLESLENSSIEITEACVPAKVLCVKLHDVANDHFENFIIEFFSAIPTSGDVKILENCTYKQFQTKCSNARLGK